MANDPRRTVRLTLAEDVATWIEEQFPGSETNKADAIKTIVAKAMAAKSSPAPAVQPEASGTPAPPSTCTAGDYFGRLEMLQASVDQLHLKYMADHPEREVTRSMEVAMEKRWNVVQELRRIAVAKAKTNAP